MVDDVETTAGELESLRPIKNEPEAVEIKKPIVTSLSVEEALAKLPPIDHNALFDEEEDGIPGCSCQLRFVCFMIKNQLIGYKKGYWRESVV